MEQLEHFSFMCSVFAQNPGEITTRAVVLKQLTITLPKSASLSSHRLYMRIKNATFNMMA
jgi:hypothetical protein